MVKRGIDIIVSFLGIILLLPMFLIIAILVRIKLGSPIYFSQSRPGKNSKIFNMIKFRSMTNDTDARGVLLPDQERLTSFGIFMRSTSIDELPNLWNVLIGKMSLVGPRPLLIECLPLYNDKQARRHDVRPGITGLAQVYGRNSLSWQAKFDLDVFYVDNRSLVLDFKILFLTIWKVIRKSDIAAVGQATMPKFKGND